MSDAQVVFVAATFAILLGATAAVQFGWLPRGRARFPLVFIAGCAAVASLWLAHLPPAWFEGSWTGFGFAALFTLWGVAHRREETSFGAPLTLGMGLTLAGANVVALWS